MEDGNLIAACEQERYDTEKHCKAFQLDAIQDYLRLGQTDWDGVDEIAFAFAHPFPQSRCITGRSNIVPGATEGLIKDRAYRSIIIGD